MLKNKLLKVVTAMICIVTMIMPHMSVVLAAAITNQTPNTVKTVTLKSVSYHEGGEESSESISDTDISYDTKAYKYEFKSGSNSTDVMKIIREDDKNSDGTYTYADAFYCLNGEKSFPSNTSTTYTRTITNFFAENPTTLGLSDENYNSLCWLLNNMYLRKQMTAEQRATQKDSLISNAFADILNDTTYEDGTTINDIKATITDDDIEVVQQWAIWYFANSNKQTLQGIQIGDSLPNLDLTRITPSASEGTTTDSMDNTRKEWLNKLYQYFITTATNNKNTEFDSGTSTYPTIANKNLSYEVDGDNYKIGPFKVTAPSSDLSSSDYSITLTNGTSELLSTAYTIKDSNGNTIDKKINQIFDTEYYVYIPTSSDIKTVKLNLSYTQFGTKASVWTTDMADYQPLVLLTKEGTPVSDSVSVAIEDSPDLALRKYIVKVNDNEVTDRTPITDTTKLSNGTSTTAEYKHKKDPVEVEVGDLVTYRIVVYNEGNVAGTATEIIDYLPDGLEFVEDNETNKNSGWTANGNVVTTTILKDQTIEPFKEKLNGVGVEIVCKVTSTTSGSVLTNIAEIKNDNIDDRDSTPGNITGSVSSTYIGSEDNKTDLTDSSYYYQGKEDDDDFEKVIVKGKSFDLSLQKFITKVNGKAVDSREPVVDTTPLKNNSSTDAKYTTVKTPVLVQTGDIVTYKIRVYNEGEVDGYAESVADYLPDGLGFLVNYNANIDNYWAIPEDSSTVKLSTITNGTKNLDVSDFKDTTDLSNVDVVKGKVKLTSTALSSSSSDNLLKAFDGSDKLSYKDIEVTCIVLSNSNLKNIAEVTKNLDSDKNEVTDRDSTPDTVDTDNYPGNDANQDDNDYEILTMGKFDLALQKFITGLNDTEITDRVPEVSYSDGSFTYKHPDTALEVNNGDSVTYTIRVYNEGEIDGYAAEIGDDIPDGLVFDSSNEINTKYGWKMYDSTGNETTDSSKAVEIRTDYLSKEKSEARNETALLSAFDSDKGNLSYLDVKAVFKVNTTSSDSTIINTAEITKDTDEDGNEIEDIDSTPDNKKDGEDDIDTEKIHVGYFDLALQKDLVKAVVTEGNTTKEIAAVDGQLMKVEINRKKINSTIVKFVYNITIRNEGTISGYAKEIKDYIPEGLQFVEGDDTNWTAGTDGTITTKALADILLAPGDTATVPVTLRWINGDSNLGLKTNIAEISEDYNDANDVDDIDSTPNNKVDNEDDIDDAPVILSISTGSAPVYIILSTGILAIIGAGVTMIKKYVL